jgi:hypothetical protein
LHEKYQDDLSSIFSLINATRFPEMVFKSFQFSLSDTGILANASVDFQNPTHITLNNLESLSFGLALKTNPIGRITVRNFKLEQGLQTLDFLLDFAMNDDQTGTSFGALLSSTINGILLGEFDIGLNLIGPLEIKQIGSVINGYTDVLKLNVPSNIFFLTNIIFNF